MKSNVYIFFYSKLNGLNVYICCIFFSHFNINFTVKYSEESNLSSNCWKLKLIHNFRKKIFD